MKKKNQKGIPNLLVLQITKFVKKNKIHVCELT
jgi:hypothetical protein